MVPDFMSSLFTPDQLRWTAIFANAFAAALIGGFLAFAVSRDAGWRCKQARIRMAHRWLLIFFSVVLVYNAYTLWETDRVPIGSAVLLNIWIIFTAVFSSYRLSHSPDLPAGAGKPGTDIKFIATIVPKAEAR